MTVFVIADLHLYNGGVLSFEHDGQPLRPFKNLAEMHSKIIERWCSVVQPSDKVYVLGDVAFRKCARPLLASLPGKKRLVRGNHDHFKDSWYHEAGFTAIHGVRQIDGIWLTHVPMHPQSMEGRARGNIHGHLHMNEVQISCPGGLHGDRRYFNCSVERIGYTPISIDEIIYERMWNVG